MIINETKNTYEDIKFMHRKNRTMPYYIACRLFFVIAGLFMFAEAMSLIQKNVAYFNYVSAAGHMGVDGVALIILIALMFLLGIAFIVFNFFFVKYNVYRAYKRIYSKWSARYMEFGDDAVTVSFEEGGIKSNASISYETFVSYARENDALYIAVRTDGKKNRFLCLHDDAYISGSVDELVSLLNNKIGADV